MSLANFATLYVVWQCLGSTFLSFCYISINTGPKPPTPNDTQGRGLPNVVTAEESKPQKVLEPETSCDRWRAKHRDKHVKSLGLKEPLGKGELSNAAQRLADTLWLRITRLEN